MDQYQQAQSQTRAEQRHRARKSALGWRWFHSAAKHNHASNHMEHQVVGRKLPEGGSANREAGRNGSGENPQCQPDGIRAGKKAQPARRAAATGEPIGWVAFPSQMASATRLWQRRQKCEPGERTAMLSQSRKAMTGIQPVPPDSRPVRQRLLATPSAARPITARLSTRAHSAGQTVSPLWQSPMFESIDRYHSTSERLSVPAHCVWQTAHQCQCSQFDSLHHDSSLQS